MSLITLPAPTVDRPDARVAHIGGLVAPGALLLLCSAGAVSIATSHSAIVSAIHHLVTLH